MQIQELKEATDIPDKTFPLNLFYIESTAELYGLPTHWHEHLEFICILKGRLMLQIDAEINEFREGDVIFINSEQIHGGRYLEPGSRIIAIVFNAALLRNHRLDSTEYNYILPLINRQISWPSYFLATTLHNAEMRASILLVDQEFKQRKAGYQLMVKAELFRLMGYITRYNDEVLNRGNHPPKSSENKDHHPFDKLLKNLSANIQQEISLVQAARMVNMSPNYFCYKFKSFTGKTLMDYINMLRVYEAERLLKESDLTITEISEKVGFASITYFGRIFRKYKNMPPSSFRKVFSSSMT